MNCRIESEAHEKIRKLIASAPLNIREGLHELCLSVEEGLKDCQSDDLSMLAGRVSSWPELFSALVSLRRELDSKQAGRLNAVCQGSADYAETVRNHEQLKKAHTNTQFMIEIIYELINIGHEFHTAEEIVEESGQVLMREFEADLVVCRLRRDDGNWENIFVGTETKNQTPIFVHYLEENQPKHPVMQAVGRDDDTMYVLSNNLQGLERGGDSYDCIAYQEGYRSRLTFILRDGEKKAIGLILLYSQIGNFFARFCKRFFEDCSKIVSLTVGRWMDVGRDALAKAAGGMAHVGNNILGIMKNCTEIAFESLEHFIKGLEKTADGHPGTGVAAQDLRESDSHARNTLSCAQNAITNLDSLRDSLDYIRMVMDHIERLKRVIQNLLTAVENPILMPYIQGVEVLDLEPKRDDMQ